MSLVVLACAGGCGDGGGSAEGSGTPSGAPAPTDTVRAVVHPFLTHAPLIIAKESGHFADHDLEVELIGLKPGTQLTPLLLSGDIDVLPLPASPSLFRAADRGARIRLVADKGLWNPATCETSYLVAHESLFEEGNGDPAAILADPDSRRVSVLRDAWSLYFVDRAMALHGLDLDRFDIVSVPAAAELDAFAEGTVDLAMISEPWLTVALEQGHVRGWVSGAEALPNFQFSYLTFGPTLLDERPDVGVRFVEAILAAVRQIEEGKTDENVRILAEWTGRSEELLRRTCWPTFAPDGGLRVESATEFQRWLVSKGLLDRVVPPEVYWDGRFLEEAVDRLQTTTEDEETNG